jgi:HTH-type transcriptional regulator/antitoxin HigA
MNIRPIRNDADYDWAIAEVSAYFDNPPALVQPMRIASTSFPT